MFAEINRGHSSRPPAIRPGELEYIALSGQGELAHGLFRSIPVERREEYANKYILREVISGGVKKLRKFLSVSAEQAAMEEKEFIDETAKLFLMTSRNNGTCPRELFESLLDWSGELSALSLLQESLLYYDEVLQSGVNRYPDLRARAILGKAAVLAMTGDFDRAQELLISLAERPYLLSDRNVIPELLMSLGKESLLRGDIRYYKDLLFRGLRHFYSTIEDRELFVAQIRRTYRHSYRVLLDPGIRMSDRFLYGLHSLYFRIRNVTLMRGLRLDLFMKCAVLGYVYWLNYVLRHSGVQETFSAPAEIRSDRRSISPGRRGILITRAMGGIGDLLMMTPALHALRMKHPTGMICLAIPGRYFPLFERNHDVTLLDLEAGSIDLLSFRKWYNLSDCPAARVESRTAPRVKRSRIEIFASALGVGFLGTKLMSHKPRYFVSDQERAYQKAFWRQHGLEGQPVVGIQLQSDEVYRDYPHMTDLVDVMRRSVHVVAFDGEKRPRPPQEGVTWVSGLPMRKAFALAGGCDLIIAPDSAFVHLAAALDIPCIGLYGPIDGEVRTRHYPLCTPIDVGKKLGCMPCWRNDRIPCKLTNMRGSVCMNDITVGEVLRTAEKILGRGEQP